MLFLTPAFKAAQEFYPKKHSLFRPLPSSPIWVQAGMPTLWKLLLQKSVHSPITVISTGIIINFNYVSALPRWKRSLKTGKIS